MFDSLLPFVAGIRSIFTQARSQDLEKGRLFWKSKKSANDLDPNFHCSWISFTRFVRKLRRNFSESSEIQRFFPPKIRWSPKKKTVFTKIETDFSAKFGNSNVWGGAVFLWGGLFSIFHKKSSSKATKTCDFAHFTSQWGGSSPPWLRYCLHNTLSPIDNETARTTSKSRLLFCLLLKLCLRVVLLKLNLLNDLLYLLNALKYCNTLTQAVNN